MLIPLSEDEPLVLASPRDLVLTDAEQHNWDEVTVIGPGERRTISLHIRVGARARGEMTRVFEVPQGSRLTIFQHVRVEESGAWSNVICIRGRGDVTIRRTIEVFGAEATVHLACLGFMEKNSRISVSDEIFLHAPNTQTQLRTKIVLADTATSEARGRIVVDESSTAGTAYERLDHLLLGEHTTAAAIPELEVKTDDVKCGHGATTGRPDDTEVFYLRSRGLSDFEAERLLARGFLTSGLTGLPESVSEQALDVMLK